MIIRNKHKPLEIFKFTYHSNMQTTYVKCSVRCGTPPSCTPILRPSW